MSVYTPPLSLQGPTPLVPPVRGPLKYEVVPSSPYLEAGTPFSLFVKITNPYNVPVTVRGFDSSLPIEIAARSKVNRGRVSFLVEDGGDSEREDLLQPGNSTSRQITVRVQRPLFFTPSTLRTQFYVDYMMDGSENQDVTDYQANVRAPLWAIIVGAVCGAAMGRSLRTLLNPDAYPVIAGLFYAPLSTVLRYLLPFTGSLLACVLLAMIVVVAFARKKDTQPVLSIEDFYGGFFVGALVGYKGVDAFPGVLGKTVSAPS